MSKRENREWGKLIYHRKSNVFVSITSKLIHHRKRNVFDFFTRQKSEVSWSNRKLSRLFPDIILVWVILDYVAKDSLGFCVFVRNPWLLHCSFVRVILFFQEDVGENMKAQTRQFMPQTRGFSSEFGVQKKAVATAVVATKKNGSFPSQNGFLKKLI